MRARWVLALLPALIGIAYSLERRNPGSEHDALRDEEDVSTRAARRNLASVRFEPRSLDLGSAEVGQRLSFSARLVNDSPVDLALGPPSSSCGCTRLQLSSTRLEAGASVRLSGTQTVTSPGSVHSRVLLPCRDEQGSERVLRLDIDVWGLSAALTTTQVVPLGRLRADASAVELSIRTHARLASESVAEVRGDLVGQVRCERAGSAELSASLRASPGAPFGAVEGLAQLFPSAASDDGHLELRLLGDSVPAGWSEEEWPNCRVVLRASSAETRVLRFPRGRLRAVHSSSEPSAGELDYAWANAEDGEGFEVRARYLVSSASPPAAERVDLLLDTDFGPTRLRCILHE